MRKRLRILMVTVALVLSGCSEIGVRQEVMVSEDIQVLYDYLQVIPEEVIMSEYDKVAGYTRCHVESEKDKEKNGYYCLYTYTKNREKFVHIAKEVSAEEKKEKEIEWNSDYRLCRSLYEGPLDAMRKETNEYQVPKVDCSTIKSYKERKLRADTTGGFRGYIDKDGKYKVPYIENWSEDSKWKLKEFSDGKWKEKKIITNKEIPSLDYYLYYGGRDGNFWYNGAWNGDEEILIVSNSKGNILGKLNLTDWKRTRKIEELQIEYTYLPDEKVIISYTKENGDEKSERVDMATGKTEKTYNMLLMGEAYDDTLVQYDSDSDYVSVYNWKTGQAMYRLDLSGLRKQYTGLEGRYVMWQYTSSGSVAGINGRVDMNICYKKF